ncbi:MAG: hypothetical protein ACREFQ_08785, partial [Stellaceae bacterium]
MSVASAPERLPRRYRLGGMARRRLVVAVRIIALAGLALWSIATPGFVTPLSITALMTAISF